jgi:hypothetical protein
MTSHPYDLKGIDLGQVGNNKYVNYTLEDFMADQDLSRRGAVRALGQNKIRLSDLQPVNKPNNILDRINMFLSGEKLNYELPKSVKQRLAEADKPSKKEKEIKDPLGNIEDFYREQMEYEREMDPFNRKGRILDNLLEMGSYSLFSPKIRRDLREDSTFKQQQLLDAEAILQGLPDRVQARQLAAAQEAATLRQSLAAQQDAATRFAGLGMQRRFG